MDQWNDIHPNYRTVGLLWTFTCAVVFFVFYVVFNSPPSIETDTVQRVSAIALGSPVFVLWISGLFLLYWSRTRLSERLHNISDRLRQWSDRALQDDSSGRLPALAKSAHYDSLEDSMIRLNAALGAVDTRLYRLQNEESRTAVVLGSTYVGILALDHNLRLLLVNLAGREMLEITGKPIPGRPLFELIRQPKIISLIQDVRDTSKVNEIEIETTGITKQILRLKASPLLSNDAPAGVLVLISDETRLKRLEAMRREFTANVSHELKTPLAAIRAYAETLLMGALEDEEANRRFVQSIADQAERLDNLIHDLLRLARLQSQPEILRPVPVVLLPLLEQCVQQHHAIGKAKDITVTLNRQLRHHEVDIDDNNQERQQNTEAAFKAIDHSDTQQPGGLSSQAVEVLGDEEALRTIFNNLLGNAIRYSNPKGFVQVSVLLSEERVLVVVEDNGIGIPEEDHERIFERFYRVEKARSSDAGGTGLGLAIVKNLVTAIGGTVQIQSTVGIGSRFTISLNRYVSALAAYPINDR